MFNRSEEEFQKYLEEIRQEYLSYKNPEDNERFVQFLEDLQYIGQKYKKAGLIGSYGKMTAKDLDAFVRKVLKI